MNLNIDITLYLALGFALLLIGLLAFMAKRDMDFGIRTITALGLGILLGILFRGKLDYVLPIGKIYVSLISAFVIPLLFFSVISSISTLNNIQRLKTIGIKSVAWLTGNTFIASTLTVIMSLLLYVGKGVDVSLPTDYVAKEVPGFTQVIIDLFPKNIVAQASNNAIVPLILFSVMIGVALVSLSSDNEKEAKPFKDFIDSGSKIIYKVISFIIELTPYAVLTLVANAVSSNGPEKLLPLLSVLLIAYIACFIQTFVVSGILIAAVAKLNPFKFFKHIWPAQVVAFTSQSSVGTIPVTVRSLKNSGVSESIASFVAPLGANVGMPGCAGIWPTLLAVFSINALGINYSITQYLFLIVLTTIVSIGTVGVPGTSTITTTAVFAAAGLPIEIIVLMTPISSIVDMARTATNVTAAATSSLLVAKSENEFDIDKYNGVVLAE
ncbi:MAG: dicarboxylate/amino acid:cation symporter [Sedimentibacter sp.]